MIDTQTQFPYNPHKKRVIIFHSTHPANNERGGSSKYPGPEDPALVIPGGDLVYWHSKLFGVME